MKTALNARPNAAEVALASASRPPVSHTCMCCHQRISEESWFDHNETVCDPSELRCTTCGGWGHLAASRMCEHSCASCHRIKNPTYMARGKVRRRLAWHMFPSLRCACQGRQPDQADRQQHGDRRQDRRRDRDDRGRDDSGRKWKRQRQQNDASRGEHSNDGNRGERSSQRDANDEQATADSVL
jgi:hypothetical protein